MKWRYYNFIYFIFTNKYRHTDKKMFNRILSTIVILTIVLVACICLNGENWNIKSKYDLCKITKMFGNPSEKFSGTEGYAKWKNLNENTPINEITVFDDKKNKKNVHITMKYVMDSKKINDVLSLSDDVLYDDVKDELIVTTTSFEAGICLLNILVDFHKDVITKEEAIKYVTNIDKYYISDKYNYRSLQNAHMDYKLKHELS